MCVCVSTMCVCVCGIPLQCMWYARPTAADILWTDIDESLWKSGMAWNRGYDKDGNNVCKWRCPLLKGAL